MGEGRDYEIVERTLEQRLRDLGLIPVRTGGGVETGYAGLLLERGETQVASLGRLTDVYASVEINAHVKHPEFGEWLISDLVSTEAATAAEALTKGAGYYLDVTFPPLQALFDAGAYQGPERGIDCINAEGAAVHFKTLTGELQILNDATGELAEYFGKQSPLGLVFNALLQVVTGPVRLHWMKLYIGGGAIGPEFGCAIDGEKSWEAETEMRANFHVDLPKDAAWAFRQFFLFVPAGAPSPESEAELRRQIAHDDAQEPAATGKRRRWWPFGKR